MADTIKLFFIEESGQGLTEYSLILAFVALAVIFTLKNFGISISNSYQNTVSKFPK